MRILRMVLTVGVFLIALSGLAAAENSGRYAGQEWALLDEAKALAAAAAITPAAYPDSDRATVDERIEFVYEPDGTGAEQDESFTKVLTERGKRDARTIILSFMLPYSTVEIPRLEIVKPSGQELPVDVAANSQESIDDSQMDENIYDPNSRLLKVSIPNLEIGDVVHAVVRETTERPIIPGQAADENLFEGGSYIRHLVYEVRSPKDRPILRKALRAEIPGKVAYTEEQEPEGGAVMRWEVSDVPRAFEEPDQPDDFEVLQRLSVSTTDRWQDVSKWYWSLSLPHLEADSPEMKAEAETLTKGARDEEARIEDLFYYVSKEIRYMGLTPEKDRPGFEPHDVRMTFTKKYGVCRDKAALLVSLLRLSGIEAYPVLISVAAKKDQDVPTPFFDHAIVAVAKKGGGYELMDPTDEHARRLLPYYDDDRSYLVCRPEGETLRTSPVSPPEENMMRISTTASLSASGELAAKSEMAFGGANDDAYRNAFSGMKPDELRRFFEARLKRAQPGARLVSLKVSPENLLDMSVPLSAEVEYSIGGLVAAGSNVAAATVPWMGTSFGLINYVIGSAGLEKRAYPMRTSVACGVDESLDVDLGNSFAGAAYTPQASSESDDTLEYRQAIAAQGRTLKCQRTFETKTVEFDPGQYLGLKRTLRLMDKAGREFPLLALAQGGHGTAAGPAGEEAPPPAPGSNARILDATKTLEVTGPHSAVYKVSYSKLVLTYEGKVSESEVKIAYNPACEKVTFLHGIVTSKDGSRQEVSGSEINVMDADWNASAKRYTGGKILVASLPGVEIGSTIEVAYEVEMGDKPFLAGSELFRLGDSIDRKTFELSAPPGVKVATRVDGPAGTVVSESPAASAGETRLRWSAEKEDPLPSESSVPPLWSFSPGVDYYVGDPAADLASLRDAMLRHATGQAKAADKARSLVAACANDQEKIRVIRDFVAEAIRRAGPYFGDLPLSELSDADTTLVDGYGHDADRAILLCAMLSAAGFAPELVLASGLPSLPNFEDALRAFPSPQEFELPLVKVAAGGGDCYLNDPDQYARLGTTLSDGRIGLDPATGGLVRISADAEGSSESSSAASLAISADGSAVYSVTTSYYGGLYAEQKRRFSELTPEERRRFFQELVAQVAQGARPDGDLSTDFDGYPGKVAYSVRIDDFAVAEGGYLCFRLPFAPTLLKLGADQRALPYLIPQRAREEWQFSIEYPKQYGEVEIAPRPASGKAAGGGVEDSIGLVSRPGGCELDVSLRAEPAVVDPKDYGQLLNFEASLERGSTWTFLLKRER